MVGKDWSQKDLKMEQMAKNLNSFVNSQKYHYLNMNYKLEISSLPGNLNHTIVQLTFASGSLYCQ